MPYHLRRSSCVSNCRCYFPIKVSKGAKIRNRYNQVPHLTQDTNGKVRNSQQTPQTRAKMSALFQQVTTKHIKCAAIQKSVRFRRIVHFVSILTIPLFYHYSFMCIKSYAKQTYKVYVACKHNGPDQTNIYAHSYDQHQFLKRRPN